MLRAYSDSISVAPGESFRLHVGGDTPGEFRADAYRIVPSGGSGTWYETELVGPLLDTFVPIPVVPDGAHLFDWNWPFIRPTIPTDWPSAPYLVVLSERDASGTVHPGPAESAYAPDGQCLLVVRPHTAGAKILYKLSSNTYHAYNTTGTDAICFYNGGWLGEQQGNQLLQTNRVTMNRPGAGTGGFTFGQDRLAPTPPFGDPNNPTAPPNTFGYLDAPFVAWLAAEGYDVDFCLDQDLHEDPDLLPQYRLLISAGHDEYWSDDMRDRAEAFVTAGGNIAFFSGNTCYRRVVYLDLVGSHYTAVRREFQIKTDDAVTNYEPIEWFARGRPENTLTCVSYRHAGSPKSFDRHTGYVVQHSDHWVFQGTSLHDGSTLGANEHLVGGEADGAHLTRAAGDPNAPYLADGTDGTSTDFTVLGVAQLPIDSTTTSPTELWSNDWGYPDPAATMGILSRHGTVFTGATIDWPRGVVTNSDVAQITRNVIDRLQGETAIVVGPAYEICGTRVLVEGSPGVFAATAPWPAPRTTTFQWTASTGETASTEDFTVTPAVGGTYLTVTVELTRDDGDRAFGASTTLVLTKAQALGLAFRCFLRHIFSGLDQAERQFTLSPSVELRLHPGDPAPDVLSLPLALAHPVDRESLENTRAHLREVAKLVTEANESLEKLAEINASDRSRTRR